MKVGGGRFNVNFFSIRIFLRQSHHRNVVRIIVVRGYIIFLEKSLLSRTVIDARRYRTRVSERPVSSELCTCFVYLPLPTLSCIITAPSNSSLHTSVRFP